MDNLVRLADDAVNTLENILPDMAEAIEKPSERAKILGYLNRLAVLVNQTRQEIRNAA